MKRDGISRGLETKKSGAIEKRGKKSGERGGSWASEEKKRLRGEDIVRGGTKERAYRDGSEGKGKWR